MSGKRRQELAARLGGEPGGARLLSVTRQEDIAALRAWARSRAVPAN